VLANPEKALRLLVKALGAPHWRAMLEARATG
jgi:hypothetical protein